MISEYPVDILRIGYLNHFSYATNKDPGHQRG